MFEFVDFFDVFTDICRLGAFPLVEFQLRLALLECFGQLVMHFFHLGNMYLLVH